MVTVYLVPEAAGNAEDVEVEVVEESLEVVESYFVSTSKAVTDAEAVETLVRVVSRPANEDDSVFWGESLVVVV